MARDFTASIPVIALLGGLSVASCTTPDVSPELKVLSAASEAGSKQFFKVIDQDLKRREQAIRNQYVAELKTAYHLPPSCSRQSVDIDRENRGKLDPRAKQPCTIIAVYQPELDATQEAKLRRLVAGLDAYFAALNALATSDDPKKMGTLIEALATDFSALAKETGTAGTVKFAAELDGLKGVLAQSATFLSKQAQYRVLRKVVRTYDPTIQKAGRRLHAYFQKRPDGGFLAARKSLRAAEHQMRQARASGNRALYGKLVAEFPKKIAAFNKARQESNVAVIDAITKAHAALDKRLQSPSNPQEIFELVSQVHELYQSIEQVTGG